MWVSTFGMMRPANYGSPVGPITEQGGTATQGSDTRGLLDRQRLIAVGIISTLYVLTRYGNLGRELTFEEGFFLLPGFEFFHSGHYRLYWGELDRSLDPFHKPPLCSLLLGFFSLFNFDPVAGARLVPFLSGWFVCVAPLFVTGSWIPSLLVLLSPFLYGAASQMQTDPTGVLIGYTLVALAIWRWNASPDRTNRLALIAGMIVLWLTRIESGAMAAVAAAIAAIAIPQGRRELGRDAAIGAAAGVLLVVIACALLALTGEIGPGTAVASVFGTVTRIVSSTVGRHAAVAGSGGAGRLALFRMALSFRVPELLLLCWIPAVTLLFQTRRDSAWLRRVAAQAALFCVPLIATFAIAYVGDGFPRYLLILIPPSLLVLGGSLECLHGRARVAAMSIVAAGAVILMAPSTFAAMFSPGSPSAFHGESGTRDAARIARAFTQKDELILAPEGEIFYLRDRRVLNIDAFDPYPERRQLATPFVPSLRAAIVRRPASPAVSEISSSIEARGATRVDVNSYSVYVFAGGESRAALCAAGAPVKIASASARRGPTGTVEWSISGQCWDASAVNVEIVGPRCESGCVLPEGAISDRSMYRLDGVADLPAGRYTVRVFDHRTRSEFVSIDIPAAGSRR